MTDDGIWTLDELLDATQKPIPLPLLSEALGRPASVVVRKISVPEHRACFPALPPESETWTDTEFVDKQIAWLTSLSEEALDARRAASAQTAYKIVAIASLQPKMTIESARRLGGEAVTAAVEILRFSGIIPSENGAAPDEPKDAPPPEA